MWVAAASVALAGPYQELAARLRNESSAEQARELVQEFPGIAQDPEIVRRVEEALRDPDSGLEDLKAAVDMRAMLEQPLPLGEAKAVASRIKQSPVYRDPGLQETSNWLARALSRLRNLRLRPPNGPDIPTLPLFGNWIYWLMWSLLGVGIGTLLYFALKHLSWQKRLKRKASALLEESEPERTLDEWLEQADRLEREGRYREAVRALYLACLLRFDEAYVARFDRSETNWEHLARIERSPKMPPGIDFRKPTQRFDRIWYGRIVRGAEDVAQFRQWYLDLTDQLGRKAA